MAFLKQRRSKEGAFRAKVREDLKAFKKQWGIFYEPIQQRSIKGSADYHLCVCGTFVALELKRDAIEEPFPIQRLKLNDVINAGGIGIVAYPANWQDVLIRLEQMCIQDRGKNVV